MKIGFFGLNQGPFCTPENMVRLLHKLEECGFESVWTGEHVVLIDPHEAPSPVPPETPFLDTVAALSFAAAHTERMKLGSGIILLPQRNPVVLAKEMASLDVVSKGRLEFGIGAGYLKAEFDALGVSFAERGARTDEYIDIMRELWTSAAPAFAGQFAQFSGIQARPQPVQVGGPPIVVGGTSAAALRRAATKCQGWYGFALDVGQTQSATDGLVAAANRFQRESNLGPLEISITPRKRLTRELVEEFEALGVSRLILLMPGQEQAELLAYVDEIADEFI